MPPKKSNGICKTPLTLLLPGKIYFLSSNKRTKDYPKLWDIDMNLYSITISAPHSQFKIDMSITGNVLQNTPVLAIETFLKEIEDPLIQLSCGNNECFVREINLIAVNVMSR